MSRVYNMVKSIKLLQLWFNVQVKMHNANIELFKRVPKCVYLMLLALID